MSPFLVSCQLFLIVMDNYLMFILFLSIWINAISSIPIVKTPMGKVSGFEYSTEDGHIANVFLGIKYGTAERFEKPVTVAPWEGILNGSSFGKRCHPWISLYENLPGITSPDEMEEDCLSLNIIVPSNLSVSSLAPVFFWVNCGGYEFGDSPMFGYKTFAEQFAKRGIIVVTSNYRLGTLGWMSLNHSSVPGNLGLWDTKLALEMARKILPSFGGDPNRITVGGESAGATMTSAMLYSKHTRDLFAQGILMSGTILTEWANQEIVYETTRNIANFTNCDRDSPLETKNCLKGKTVAELQEAVLKTPWGRIDKSHPWPPINLVCVKGRNESPFGSPTGMFSFHPVIDGDFFHSDIQVDMMTSTPKPMFIGFNTNESSLLYTYPNLPYFVSNFLPKDQLDSLTREDLVNYVKERVLYDVDIEDITTPSNNLIDIYMELHNGYTPAVYAQLHTDIQFTLPAFLELSWWRYNGWKNIYAYVNHVVSPPGNTDDRLRGAWHASEVGYISDLAVFPKDWNEENKLFQRSFAESFANFIKTSSPSSSSFEWISVTNEQPLVHGAFQPLPTIQHEYRPQILQFWTELWNTNRHSKLYKRIPALRVAGHTLYCKSAFSCTAEEPKVIDIGQTTPTLYVHDSVQNNGKTNKEEL